MLPIVGFALFTAAGLVFAVQPLMSKLLLPLFGGSALVWAASLVFFQAGLLLGYSYAYASSRWLSLRKQVALQCAVVLIPVLTLPLAVRAEELASGAAPPAAVLGILAVSVGLPYIALASTSPLLQHWFSKTTHPTASDPYFLYAAGNAGSLIGLLAYPFVFEPLMTLSAQRWLWSATYLVFVALMIPTGWLILRRAAKDHGERGSGGRDSRHRPGADGVPHRSALRAMGPARVRARSDAHRRHHICDR